MSIATANLNVLAQSVRDRAQVLREAGRIGGGMALVMDEPQAVRDALQALGGTSQIVYRRWLDMNADGNGDEHRLWQIVSPQTWLDMVRFDSGPRVIYQCHNEPMVDASTVASFVGWHVQLLKMPSRPPLAVGTFAVGNPREELIADGHFDAMLRALRSTDALLLHEYFLDEAKGASEYPWLCGRLAWWLARLRATGSACRTVIVGEYGRDRGGGLHDGWRGQGWSAEQYAQKLIRGMEQVYAPLAAEYGVRIHNLVFCAGAGGRREWASFDVENEPAVYDALATWNRRAVMATNRPTPIAPVAIIPRPTGAGRPGKLTRVPADQPGPRLIRQQPDKDASVMGRARLNQRLTWWPDEQRDGWVYVDDGLGAQGWMLLAPGVEIGEVPAMVAPPPAPPVLQLNADDLAALVQTEAAVARIYKQIADLNEQLSVAALQRQQVYERARARSA